MVSLFEGAIIVLVIAVAATAAASILTNPASSRSTTTASATTYTTTSAPAASSVSIKTTSISTTSSAQSTSQSTTSTSIFTTTSIPQPPSNGCGISVTLHPGQSDVCYPFEVQLGSVTQAYTRNGSKTAYASVGIYTAPQLPEAYVNTSGTLYPGVIKYPYFGYQLVLNLTQVHSAAEPNQTYAVMTLTTNTTKPPQYCNWQVTLDPNFTVACQLFEVQLTSLQASAYGGYSAGLSISYNGSFVTHYNLRSGITSTLQYNKQTLNLTAVDVHQSYANVTLNVT